MIVCLCKGVSHKTVLAAIEAGASSVESVGAACGAGTDCGGCHGAIGRMIDAADGCPRARRLPLAPRERAA